jgi:hypothetical protein
MKKNVLIFGLMSGILASGMMLSMIAMCYSGEKFEPNEVLGYAAQIVAFAFVFVGIKNYRDKYNHGVISFGKAFKVGLFITLIASTLYVLTWLIAYYNFYPDFMDKYCTHMAEVSQQRGIGEVEMARQSRNMAQMKEWYKNPLFVVLITYTEIIPTGLVVALISALILKRKQKKYENFAS